MWKFNSVNGVLLNTYTMYTIFNSKCNFFKIINIKNYDIKQLDDRLYPIKLQNKRVY
jgi:hypothetical protein